MVTSRKSLLKFVLLLTVASIPWLALLPASHGDEVWPVRYNGPGNSNDEATAIALDAQGNVYVTGWSMGVDSSEDYATIKCSPTGARLWVRRYNGPGNGNDSAEAIAVDSQGNVYVARAGGSTGDGTAEDYAIVKYSP